MKIDVYSHCIKVTKVLSERDLQAMMSFCKPLVEMGFEKKGKRFYPKALRTYAAATRDRKEFSFHRNQLADLKYHLFNRLMFRDHEAEIVHHPLAANEYPKEHFKIAHMFPPRDNQPNIIEYVLDNAEKFPKWDAIIKMVALQTGKGKALSVKTPVRTADLQWKLLGQLKVGDKILSRDGTATTVTGYYPQGLRQLYRVTFEDGRFVDADLEHLWHVVTGNGQRTITTGAMMSLMARKAKVQIPLYTAPAEQRAISMSVIAKYYHSKKDRDGMHVMSTSSAIGLAFHVRAVGGKAKITDVGDGQSSIVIEIRPKDKLLAVKSIKPVEIEEAACISVDHPDKLYVVKDFIVTHNTYIAQYCMKELCLRTVIHFKGGYVERWKGDLEKTFEFKRGELLIVRGTKDLIALQNMALEGTLKAQVIIITTGTMREYFKNYEESNGRSTVYPMKPIDFYPKCGIGFRVGDEIHQEFHNNFKIDLYTHVAKSLSLSATMESSDPFKNKMYSIAYPPNQRHDGGGYDAYIAVTAVMYHIGENTKVRYMGAQGYSHTTFEESVMRNPVALKSYFKIIERQVYDRFVGRFENGQKMLIFCALVDMCTALVERLKRIHPDFNIVRYVGSQDDSYDDLLEADIGVTTIGSGGTAIDIPNLRVSLMTTAIDSRQSNEQVLGRTRRLKDWPDIEPEFVYFVCTDIEQHVKYHQRKKEFFKGKVVSHGELNSISVL